MPEDNHPWRKQVQERIEEYLIALLGGPAANSLDDLTEEIARNARVARMWKVLRELPGPYRIVVEVLELKKPFYPVRYPELFPDWPKGRRKGLLQLLNVAPRTLEDWHAKALDQMAEALGLKETSLPRAKPRVRKSEEEMAQRRADCHATSRSSWWRQVEDTLWQIGYYGFRIKSHEYTAHVAAARTPRSFTAPDGRVVPLAVSLPPDPRQERDRAFALVRDVLITPQSRNLIGDRYWDPEFNQTDHPDIPVKVYMKRLDIGRTRYYQLWTEAMRKIAAYWGIPIEEDN